MTLEWPYISLMHQRTNDAATRALVDRSMFEAAAAVGAAIEGKHAASAAHAAASSLFMVAADRTRLALRWIGKRNTVDGAFAFHAALKRGYVRMPKWRAN